MRSASPLADSAWKMSVYIKREQWDLRRDMGKRGWATGLATASARGHIEQFLRLYRNVAAAVGCSLPSLWGHRVAERSYFKTYRTEVQAKVERDFRPPSSVTNSGSA